MGNVKSASLNQAIVVSGGCTSGERKMVVGGWTWAWWLVSDVQVLIRYQGFALGLLIKLNLGCPSCNQIC